MENKYVVLAFLEDSDPDLSSPDLPLDHIAADGHLAPPLHPYGDHPPLVRDLHHDALLAANGDLAALLRFDVHFAPHRLANRGLDVSALVFANGDVAALLAAKGDDAALLRDYGCIAPRLHVDRELQLAGLIAANRDVAALLASKGDHASLLHADGYLSPFLRATGDLDLPALLAANGDLSSLLHANGGLAVNEKYGYDDNIDYDKEKEKEEEQDAGWIVVKRSHRMSRKMCCSSPQKVTTISEELPLDEVEWLPKIAPLRAIKKWAQVRRGGATSTLDGLAAITYPFIVPPRERT